MQNSILSCNNQSKAPAKQEEGKKQEKNKREGPEWYREQGRLDKYYQNERENVCATRASTWANSFGVTACEGSTAFPQITK